VAIYHLSVKIIGRGSGRSAVASSAYRAGEKLHSQYDGKNHDYTIQRGVAYRSGEEIGEYDYTKRHDVIHSEIMLPSHAPKEYSDRQTLWNEVEKTEKAKNARLAREVVVALPNELNEEQQKQLVQDYIQRNFVDNGMCADFSIHSGHIHEKKDEIYPFQDLTVRKDNPHAHIMLTVRPINKDGSWGEKSRKEYILDKNGKRIRTPKGNYKCRKIELTNWDKIETLERWREDWARTVNKDFQRLEIDERIDHRTLQAQGIDRTPTKHMGHDSWNKEVKGTKTKIGNENREIMRSNAERIFERIADKIHELKEKHFSVHTQTIEIKEQIAHLEREIHILNITAEEIFERAGDIQATKDKLEELTTERQELGFFVSKKEIDKQIQRLERSQQQASAYFERKYGVTPEETAGKIKQLEKSASEKRRSLEQLRNRLEPLKQQQENILFEYQHQKLLADISHDKQKIYNRLSELEKQSRPQKQSAQYAIMQADNQRLLDTISQRNFERILRELSPEKQKALEKLREHERTIERSISRTR
jgi:hypothetical protein